MKKLMLQAIKQGIKNVYYFLYYCFAPRRTIVLMFCSMRSGSTLLKALLAEASDVSNLPETDYRKHYYGNPYEFYYNVAQLSPKRIIVLKAPLWFTDINHDYKIPPLKCIKLIALYRDAYEVIKSCEKMIVQVKFDTKTKEELVEYWCKTYEKITAIVQSFPSSTTLTYEDLLQRPKDITKELFAFIGSRQKEGVKSYHKPDNYEWKWGSDDGGEKIKSMKVTAPETTIRDDQQLVKAIESSQHAQDLRKQLGYL